MGTLHRCWPVIISYPQRTVSIYIAIELKFAKFLSVWYKYPTIIILETMTYPIEELIFPTVTVCPKHATPDRWGVTIQLFDFMKKKCSKEG